MIIIGSKIDINELANALIKYNNSIKYDYKNGAIHLEIPQFKSHTKTFIFYPQPNKHQMDLNDQIKKNKETVKQIISEIPPQPVFNLSVEEYYEKQFDKALAHFNCIANYNFLNGLVTPVHIYFDSETKNYFVSSMNHKFTESLRPEILLVKTSMFTVS